MATAELIAPDYELLAPKRPEEVAVIRDAYARMQKALDDIEAALNPDEEQQVADTINLVRTWQGHLLGDALEFSEADDIEPADADDDDEPGDDAEA